MSQTIIKAAGARDFLGLLPSLIGYTPTESVVVVPFDGGRTIGAMRFDLPHQDYAPVAQTMIGMICKLPEASGILAVVYTSEPHHTTLTILDELGAQARTCGLEVKDLLYVAGNGYGSMHSDAEPAPITDLVAHPEAPDFAVGDQSHHAALPKVAEPFAVAVLDSIGIGGDQLDAILEGPEALILLAERLATGVADATDIATLHWVLERPALRDVLLVSVARGSIIGTEALVAQLLYEEGAPYPEELASIMWGAGPRPDAARLEQALGNITTLLAIITAPGAYSAAAWLSWALGRSTAADAFAQKGLAQVDHGLCEIVAAMVHAGHLPEWAFSR